MKTDNELVASFMGLKWEYQDLSRFAGKDESFWMLVGEYPLPIPGRGMVTQRIRKPEVPSNYGESLDYHKSWDWLMTVVEKIEGIRHIGIDAVYFKIEGTKCQIWTYFDVKEFLRLTGDDKNEGNKFKVGISSKTKIESTYQAVVEFIKWFNNQSK